MAIDIPIGTDFGPRQCDAMAEEQQCIFRFMRPAIQAGSRQAADRIARKMNSAGVGAQVNMIPAVWRWSFGTEKRKQ